MARRFQTLSGMALTLLAALVIGMLLEAEGLKIWAERLQLGPLRSVSLPLAQGWHDMLAPLGVEAPRRAALVLKADLADRFAPPVQIAQEAAGEAAQVSNTAATDAPAAVAGAPETAEHDPIAQIIAGAAVPAVAQSPALASVAPRQDSTNKAIPAGAPRVVLAGDSMMAVGLAPVLRRGLGVKVIKAYRSGTGLARPEVFDWLVQYPVMVGEAHPQLVICAMGANDGQNVQIGKKVLVFGSPEWDAFYRERLTGYLDLITRDGHKVLWVGLPVMRSPAFASKMVHMNALIRDVLQAYPQVSWLDPNPALGYAQGSFAQYRPDARGKMIKLRADDGIHMTDDGAAFLLPGIRNWLAQHLDLPANPPVALGESRSNPVR